MKDEEKIEQVKAKNILKLVKEHKKTCKEDCGISTYWLLEDFERHMGRKATENEMETFL